MAAPSLGAATSASLGAPASASLATARMRWLHGGEPFAHHIPLRRVCGDAIDIAGGELGRAPGYGEFDSPRDDVTERFVWAALFGRIVDRFFVAPDAQCALHKSVVSGVIACARERSQASMDSQGRSLVALGQPLVRA